MEPPYFAVIFTSVASHDLTGYAEAARHMEELAAQQPGYMGLESARSDLGITVSYWADETAIAAWRENIEHTIVRERGRAQWYRSYELRVARVERAYSWSADD